MPGQINEFSRTFRILRYRYSATHAAPFQSGQIAPFLPTLKQGQSRGFDEQRPFVGVAKTLPVSGPTEILPAAGAGETLPAASPAPPLRFNTRRRAHGAVES